MTETAKLDRTNPPKHGLTGPRIYRHVDVPEVATSYEDLVLQLIARRHQLGWTQRELDDRAGWADGYAGKIETSPGASSQSRRRPSSSTFATWLDALGVVLVGVPGHGELPTAGDIRSRIAGAQLLDVAFTSLLPLGLGLRAVPRDAISDELPAFRIGKPYATARTSAPSTDEK
jgi:transcriptional regulator with XRE-family HTH domain